MAGFVSRDSVTWIAEVGKLKPHFREISVVYNFGKGNPSKSHTDRILNIKLCLHQRRITLTLT